MRWLSSGLLLVVAGCVYVEPVGVPTSDIGSFRVQVEGVYQVAAGADRRPGPR
jgi:hypothetical protein